MNRRDILRITGGLAATAALPSGASAQPARPPKRLVVVFSPDGTIQRAWRPTGSATDFNLGSILAPLEPFKNEMVILDGVRRLTRGSGDGHEQGMTQILTGRPNLSGATRSTGPSIDEFVNLRVGERRPVLRLGVMSKAGATNWTRMTFGESGNVLHPESNPYKARDVLFAGFTPGPAGSAGPSPAELRRRAIRKSVLDYARSRVSRLAAGAGDLDRADLQAHVRSIESLQNEPLPGAPSAQCSIDRISAWPAGINVGANDSFPTVTKMQMELISAAFACDRARVAVLQCSMSNSEVFWRWIPGAGASPEHHGLSHYEFGNRDPQRSETLTGVYRWHAQQIASLVGDLKAKGLMDNTVVFWTSEMGEGANHSANDIPMVIIGGAGHFRTGRYMDYRSTGGVSHCDVLTSLCNSMGIEIDKFGDTIKCNGPLKGVT